jgi:phospholipid-translocating ATPase
MNYLGLSGVEDLLQEEVRETIESLREARIRIWILTGDKVETAKCIAKSTGLKAKDEIFYEMLSLDPLEIENQISKLSSKQNTCLVIQGSVVTKIYEMNAQKGFFNSIKNFPAVVFCRCSPTQKAIIAKSLQEF